MQPRGLHVVAPAEWLVTATAIINWHFQRDFTREWVESLRVKHPKPLGEEAAARMMAQHSK